MILPVVTDTHCKLETTLVVDLLEYNSRVGLEPPVFLSCQPLIHALLELIKFI